jgi:hypothetical protein
MRCLFYEIVNALGGNLLGDGVFDLSASHPSNPKTRRTAKNATSNVKLAMFSVKRAHLRCFQAIFSIFSRLPHSILQIVHFIAIAWWASFGLPKMHSIERPSAYKERYKPAATAAPNI